MDGTKGQTETRLKLSSFYLSDTFDKTGGNGDLPVFLLKVGIQKSYLFLRNRKFMWFKMTENIQRKTHMQAGSPEVRFFCTYCRLQ